MYLFKLSNQIVGMIVLSIKTSTQIGKFRGSGARSSFAIHSNSFKMFKLIQLNQNITKIRNR